MSAATEQGFIQRTAGRVALWAVPVIILPLTVYYFTSGSAAESALSATVNSHAIRLTTLEVIQQSTDKKLDRIDEKQDALQDATSRILQELATVRAMLPKD